MSRNERLAAIVGAVVVVGLWAVLMLVTGSGGQTVPAVLPTEAALPTVTVPSEILHLPLNTTPDEPETPQAQAAANQIIIQFAPDSTQAERDAFVESLDGSITRQIEPLNAAVLTLPDSVSLPASPLITASEPDFLVTALLEVPTSDTYYAEQWALNVIGAPEAWLSLPDNAPLVRVAVIDSGICAAHPDLNGRVLNGYDFVDDDTAPDDAFGHGCAVSGVIAANIDNAEGIAGVAPNAQIMPLRVLDAQGVGTYSDVAAAIIYAADAGAQVINLSLGGPNASNLLADAVRYAVERDVLVIAAAGNTGREGVLYPAAYNDVIAVGAIDPDLRRSSFSTYGPQIALLAPGRNIMTTSRSGAYAALNGTSMAAPHVSGAAALLLAQGESLVLDGGILSLSQASTAQATPAPVNIAPQYQPLYDKAVRDGAVPVIVELNAAWQPEAQLSTAQAQAQRASIMQVRGALVADLNALNVQIKTTSTQWQIPFVALRADPAALVYLAQSPDVVSIDEDRKLVKQLIRSVPHIDADLAHDSGYDGSGQAVAILDDGIDAAHEFFGGRVVAEACFSNAFQETGDRTVCPNNQQTQIGSGAAGISRCQLYDPCYHGTHVAGIAAGDNGHPSFAPSGVARGADIIAVQVFTGNIDCNDQVIGNQPCLFSWASDQIEGLQHVLNLSSTYDIAAVNLSVGSAATFTQIQCVSSSYSAAIDALEAVNIATIIASGNSSDPVNMSFPACLPDAISVGSIGVASSQASTIADVVSSFSNGSTSLDLLAPGGYIASSIPGDVYAWAGGTSMAAPHVAGAWTILKQADPDATVAEVLAALVNTGVPVTDTRQGVNNTRPRIDVDNALNVLLPPLVVNSTNDTNDGACNSSHCSLREAIIASNASPTARDVIRFNIGAGGQQTITLGSSPLPIITSPVIIDGTSQPGYTSAPLIEIDGVNVTQIDPLLEIGLNIIAGNSEVRGLVINNFGSAAINLSFGGGNIVTGNYLGTEPNGTTAAPNREGVRICSSSNNRIGGTTTAQRNLISGNSDDGMNICQLPGFGMSANNLIQGNYIGLTAAGTAALGNGDDGINIVASTDTTIGGTTTSARNIISGNGSSGIRITGPSAAGHIIQGNYIGTLANGTAPAANGALPGGVTAPPETAGILIVDSSNNLIGGTTTAQRNIISGNTDTGIAITGPAATNNTIQGNHIGTSANGAAAVTNGYIGVSISNSASGNLVGGTVSGARNVISGNGLLDDGGGQDRRYGVAIWHSAANNTVQGNYIGINATGSARLGNGQAGVFVGYSATGNLIGGVTTAERNIISGNPYNTAILFANGNIVSGNYMGTAPNGTTNLAHPESAYGVIIQGGSNNIIGGTATGAGNLIAFSGQDGVYIVNQNDVTATGNALLGNRIYSNTGIGIDLDNFNGGLPDGVTANDLNDTDTGANNLQNFPVLTSADATYNTVTIGGTLNSAANTTFRVEFFSSDACDPSGYGEGQNFLGAHNVTTDGSGNASFSAGFTASLSAGQRITATATDPGNNTSEFSACQPVSLDVNTLVVNTTSPTNDGVCNAHCSLPDAIAIANATSGTQTAVFNIPGAGPHIIQPTAMVPGVSNMTIDGTTQPGYAGSPLIIINGSLAPNVSGLVLGSNSVIRGLMIRNYQNQGISVGGANNVIGGPNPGDGNVISGNTLSGILLGSENADTNIVQGNYIGTDASGMSALANGQYGVDIRNGADGNLITGNLISGNAVSGVLVRSATSQVNQVRQNMIGTNLTLSAALPNAQNGVELDSSTLTEVVDNIIGGNTGSGIVVTNAVSATIQTNHIGAGGSDSLPDNGITPINSLPNGQHGIRVVSGTGTRIGGPTEALFNIIGFNGADGIFIEGGSGHDIDGNVIESNGGLGIDLGPNGVTPNDPGDTDSGANGLQNFPVISAVVATIADVSQNVTLNSAANTTFRLDFYNSDACDASGSGEGRWYVGTQEVTTNGSGTYNGTIALPRVVETGSFMTVTATNLTTRNTSEFSACAEAVLYIATPLNFAAQVISEINIELTWTDASIDETHWLIERSRAGQNNWTQIASIPTTDAGGTGAEVVYNDATFLCSRAYDYRLRAQNQPDAYYSLYTPIQNVAPTCPPLVAPDNFGLTPAQRQIDLAWTDSNTTETAYRIDYSTNGGQSWALLTTTAANAQSYSLTGLICGTTHSFRLRAERDHDSAVSGFTPVQTTTTTVCPPLSAPTSPAASALSRSTVQLTWADSTSGQTTAFHVERSANGVDWTQFAVVPVSTTSVIDSNRNCGQTYQYRVRAFRLDDNAFSPYSSSASATTSACPTPVSHTVGLYKDGIWHFWQSTQTNQPAISFSFGPAEPGWTAVIGDWDGDGTDGIGLYKNGLWLLRNASGGSAIDTALQFGPAEPGWTPVVGDWDGDGTDGIGLYKNGLWLLRQTPTQGQPQISFYFGPAEPDWKAVAGDWNGAGTTRVGLYKDGLWLLSSQLPGAADVPPFIFGQAGWMPVAGDWDEDSRETAGVYKDGMWQLRNSSTGGAPDAVFGLSIGSGWQPVSVYEGGMSGLTALSLGPDSHPTSVPPTVQVTTPAAPESPTLTPVPEITEDALPTHTPEPSPTPTETPPPSTTPEIPDDAPEVTETVAD